MNIKKIVLFLATISMLFSFVPFKAYAEESKSVNLLSEKCKYVTADKSGVCSDNGKEATTVAAKVINTLFYIVGIAAVVIIIYSGILFVLASGDPGKIATAKRGLIYACIGLIVALMSYAIVNFVVNATDKK